MFRQNVFYKTLPKHFGNVFFIVLRCVKNSSKLTFSKHLKVFNNVLNLLYTCFDKTFSTKRCQNILVMFFKNIFVIFLSCQDVFEKTFYADVSKTFLKRFNNVLNLLYTCFDKTFSTKRYQNILVMFFKKILYFFLSCHNVSKKHSTLMFLKHS